MRSSVRMGGVAGIAALGVAAAVAVGARGDDGVRACASKQSGQIRATLAKGKCRSGELAITISGDAFKSSRNGTLTINGVAFKGGKRDTITINGNSFKRSGKTLTINGVAFTPAATPTPRPPDAAASPTPTPSPVGVPGSPGTDGARGPTGPPGIPYGPPPVEAATPVPAGINGDPVSLVSVNFSNSDGVAHRVLLMGGANTVCGPCPATESTRTYLRLARDGSPDPLVQRRLTDLGGPDGVTGGSGSLSEIVVTPTACGPCTYSLLLRAINDTGAVGKIDGFDARLGIVDLGPVTNP